MKVFEQLIADNSKHIPAIEQALRETYFSGYDQQFLLTDNGRNDIENNVFRRYNHSLRHVVPWLSRVIDLAGKNVLEIGCGTGSSTAALAHFVRRIEGYDIHSLAVRGAEKRLEIMGLDNARLHVIKEEELITRITGDAEGGYDIILLFAVLEHQTVAERHDTLAACWGLLSEGGIMAVIDTPNILHYFDLHTSKLPFLHMLPNRLYARYAAHSPRPAFARSFADEKNMADDRLDLEISRWGRGASYHDFELALGGDYGDFLVAGGFEPEILDWFPCTIEEELLRWYVQHKNFAIPLGFTRCVLNLIFRKPSSTGAPLIGAAPDAPPALAHFNPDVDGRVTSLERQFREKEDLIDKIYRSATWRAGSLVAAPWRIVRRLFRI
ncbi:MAG TPA: class I SAM-dependent methyltransferase [Desulfobacteraceae bacterium]|nr:class I SAM-dependent methyltransferase [Desulfobacteraceae bacterium]